MRGPESCPGVVVGRGDKKEKRITKGKMTRMKSLC